MIPLKVTYHVTKNPNNIGEIGASVLHWQKTSEISAEFQKITLRRWVFRFGFFGVFRGSCPATFNEKPECEKDSGFFYASVNGTHDDIERLQADEMPNVGIQFGPRSAYPRTLLLNICMSRVESQNGINFFFFFFWGGG